MHLGKGALVGHEPAGRQLLQDVMQDQECAPGLKRARAGRTAHTASQVAKQAGPVPRVVAARHLGKSDGDLNCDLRTAWQVPCEAD